MNLPAFRSILFVPGDRPDRYEKALAAGAEHPFLVGLVGRYPVCLVGICG